MGTWFNQSEDPYIPDWLKDKIPCKCKYCGSDMLNYYNDDLRCTNRKCSNSKCYGFVAAKADFARKLIGIKGIGFAGCLQDARNAEATTPFQLFRVWNIRPIVSVDQFLRMHCFEGVDLEWEKIVKQLGIYTLDDLYSSYNGKWLPLLLENKEEIYSNAEYVQFTKKPDFISESGPEAVVTIMITGTPNGYRTKEEFINTLNEACSGRIVIMHQKTKRQSGVDFLIREPGSTTRGKVEAAVKGGIPIVTSEEFITLLIAMMNKLNGDSENHNAENN